MQSLGLLRLVFDTGLTVTHRPYRVGCLASRWSVSVELNYLSLILSLIHPPTLGKLVQCLLWLGYIMLYLHHLLVRSYGLLYCGRGFWAIEGFCGQIVMNSKVTRCPCNEKYITNQISNFLSSSSCPLTVTYTTCGRLGLNIAKAHPEPAFHLRKSSINTPRV